MKSLELPQDLPREAGTYWPTLAPSTSLRASLAASKDAGPTGRNPPHKTMPLQQPPTGRTIVRELVKEMEEQLYPLMYRTLPPSVFHVYLHPDDYRAVETVAPLIASDAAQGLTARVEDLNKRSRLLSFVAGQAAPIDIPAGGWEVHIQPELNGEIRRGDFRIESRLAVPATPTYNDGVATVRIGRTTVSGDARRTTRTEETNAPFDAVAPAAARPAPVPVSAPASVPASASAAAAVVGTPRLAPSATLPVDTAATTKPTGRHDDAGTGYARLAYVDEQGPHVFVIRKEVVAIGRGGTAHWVDVQVVSTARVSRVHCRIRRDATGRFFIQDVSTWGTFVDGERAPAFIQRLDEGTRETGAERELPPSARIQLADAVTLEFQVLAR